ncbi:hypothetical protein ASPZODRAFT_13454 [Penicilliopsis zonata CBS 506.65]|uniref:Invertebrate defensins family profile domain-containing protein n=1 Tax=Penicilliopsis zonata CBS 506.65 TaxID=1073090 RepID=A0A1L9ST44_9EURO|nr:hypothetical protein ASPZODRAFT_13454 [Penicilliopsis zonata CBS 506.65]OJJ50370.1 hypothetical protein ASPZODRAFT_13454 [Penicilliopsis zonata CBS 506.65]
MKFLIILFLGFLQVALGASLPQKNTMGDIAIVNGIETTPSVTADQPIPFPSASGPAVPDSFDPNADPVPDQLAYPDYEGYLPDDYVLPAAMATSPAIIAALKIPQPEGLCIGWCMGSATRMCICANPKYQCRCGHAHSACICNVR